MPLPLLPIAGGLVLAGGAGWAFLRGKRSDQKEPAPKAPASGAGEQPAPAKSADELMKGGAAALAAAAGGLLGDTLQRTYFDPTGTNKVTSAAAPGVGAAIAGGAVALAGPQLVLIVPVVAAVAAVLGTANALESELRAARRQHLQTEIAKLLESGRGKEAWNVALRAAEDEGINGLGWQGHSLYDATSVLLEDGRSLDIRQTLDAAYANAQAAYDAAPTRRDPNHARMLKVDTWSATQAFRESKALGDGWAAAFERAVPWLTRGVLHREWKAATDAELAAAETARDEARADLGLAAPRPRPPPSPRPPPPAVGSPPPAAPPPPPPPASSGTRPPQTPAGRQRLSRARGEA